jgi:hypothetical protein
LSLRFDNVIWLVGDRPWFNSELRRETRKRDHIRKTAKKYNKQSDIDKYKKQKNKVNNLKKTAKEHFEDDEKCELLNKYFF